MPKGEARLSAAEVLHVNRLETSVRLLPPFLVALALALPSASLAADSDEEEVVDTGAYSVTRKTREDVRPKVEIAKPDFKADFSFGEMKPALEKPTVQLQLDPAAFSQARPVVADEAEEPRTRPARQSAGADRGPQVPEPEPEQAATQQQASSPPARASGGGGSAGPDVVPVEVSAPRYPRDAYLSKTTGFVTLEFTIQTDGTVDEIDVVESEPRSVFDREAARAVRRWLFEPVRVDGQAVPYRVRHTIEFNLDE